MVSDERAFAWSEENPPVMRWLNRVAPTTRRTYARFLYRFFHWLIKNPEYANVTVKMLVEEQKLNGGYNQLDLIQDYVRTLKGRRSWKETVYTAIRSFYMHNRAELPRDPGFRIRGDTDPVVGSLTIEGIRSIIMSLPLRMKAPFLIRWMSAMGSAEFIHWNLHGWPKLKEQLDSGADLIRVDIPRRKRNSNPYYTFFGQEAITVLKEYLEKERGPIKHGEAIFLNTHGHPLTARAFRAVFLRAGFRVGVIEQAVPMCPNCNVRMKWTRKSWPVGNYPIIYRCLKCDYAMPAKEAFPLEKRSRVRYGASPHEMRDVWKSEWHRSGADIVVADFMMGHTIDPLGYDKVMKLHPEYAEAQYRKAEPYLSLSRSTDVKEAVATLEERLRTDQKALRKQLSLALRLLMEGNSTAEEISKLLEEA